VLVLGHGQDPAVQLLELVMGEIRSAEVDILVGCAKVGHLASSQSGDPQLRL
jgi:hypothetical protein